MKSYSSVFYYTSVANLFFFLGNSLFILLPVYLKNLGAHETYIGFISNMDKIFMVATALMLGSHIRHHDRVLLLRLGYALLLLTFCCYLPLTSLAWYLPFIRVFHGIGFGVAMILGSTIIFEQVPPERATEAIGLYGISGAISNAVSPAIGEFILTKGYPHQILFLLSVLFILTSLLITFFIPRSYPQPDRNTPTHGDSTLSLLHKSDFLLYSIASFIFGGGFGVIITFLPNFIRTCTNLNYSYFFIIYIAVLIGIRVFFLHFISINHTTRLLFTIFLIGGIMNLLVNYLTSLWMLVTIAVMYGVTHGVLYPVLNALMVNIAPKHQRGRANALFSGLFNAGMLIFACTMGVLIDYFQSYLAAFNVCSIAFFIACVMIVMLSGAQKATSA